MSPSRKKTAEKVQEIKKVEDLNPMPFDVPCYIKIHRLLGSTKPRKDLPKTSELKGWTIELDFFTMGVVVYLKITRPFNLKVFMGTKKIGEHEGKRKA